MYSRNVIFAVICKGILACQCVIAEDDVSPQKKFIQFTPTITHDYLKQAQECIRSGCYEEFAEYLKGMSDEGDIQAQCMLGALYCRKQPQRPKEAIKLFEESYKNGNLYGAVYLADMYTTGFGIEKNAIKATALLNDAADRGCELAFNRLGTIYYQNRNYKKALEFFKKAADKNEPDSTYSMGVCLQKGLGTTKNIDTAFKYYEQAAMNDHYIAQYNLAAMYIRGEGTKKDFQKAIYWLEKAAGQDMPEAQASLGLIYANICCGIPRANEMAEYWLNQAKKNGVSEKKVLEGVEKIKQQNKQKKIHETKIPAELISSGIKIKTNQSQSLKPYCIATLIPRDEVPTYKDPRVNFFVRHCKDDFFTVLELRNFPNKKIKVSSERIVKGDWTPLNTSIKPLSDGSLLFVKTNEELPYLSIVGSRGFLPGEKVTYYFESNDKSFKKAISIIPNPLYTATKDGSACIEAELICAEYSIYVIRFSGFEVDEMITFKSSSENELLKCRMKLTEELIKNGMEYIPAVANKIGGDTEIIIEKMATEECIKISLPWGFRFYELLGIES